MTSPMRYTVLKYLALLAGLGLFGFPFVWMVLASFKPEAEIAALNPWPSTFSLDSYARVLQSIPVGQSLMNSLLVAGTVTAGSLVLGSMVAYALAKLEWRGREMVFRMLLLTMMVPFIVLLIPLYTLVVRLGLADSLAGLIVPFLFSGTGILILRQAFLTIPRDLLDAARVDGCSEPRILFTIVWPLSVPALITAGLLTFIGAWNEVLWPLIVVRDPASMTLPQAVALYAVGGAADARLGPQLAAAVLLAAPIVVAYLLFQRRFVESLATSGLKS